MSIDLQTIAYHEGEFKKLVDCNVNISTHALQYGTAIFGGMRGYYNAEKDNVFVFRPDRHVRRLHRSAHIMQMQPTLPENEMMDVILEVVRRNEARKNVYLRPFIYKSAMQLSPRLHDVKDSFAVYMLELDDYLDTKNGQKTVISSWRRIDENIIPTRAKVSGGYVNSALAKSEAVQNGFDEAIFLDIRGMVSEGSAENIFMVRDGILYTPSFASALLEGIVRSSIMEVARDEGLEVCERDIARTELYIADELFFTGTGAQVAWISEVDRRTIGNGEMGPITKRIQERFINIVNGNDSKFGHWAVPVY